MKLLTVPVFRFSQQHRKGLQLAAEWIQDEAETLERGGAKKRSVTGLAKYDEGIASCAAIFEHSRADPTANYLSIAKNELPLRMRLDPKGSQNFRGRQAST